MPPVQYKVWSLKEILGSSDLHTLHLPMPCLCRIHLACVAALNENIFPSDLLSCTYKNEVEGPRGIRKGEVRNLVK